MVVSGVAIAYDSRGVLVARGWWCGRFEPRLSEVGPCMIVWLSPRLQAVMETLGSVTAMGMVSVVRGCCAKEWPGEETTCVWPGERGPTGSLGAVQRRGQIPLLFFVLPEISVWLLDRISTVMMSASSFFLLEFCCGIVNVSV